MGVILARYTGMWRDTPLDLGYGLVWGLPGVCFQSAIPLPRCSCNSWKYWRRNGQLVTIQQTSV